MAEQKILAVEGEMNPSLRTQRTLAVYAGPMPPFGSLVLVGVCPEDERIIAKEAKIPTKFVRLAKEQLGDVVQAGWIAPQGWVVENIPPDARPIGIDACGTMAYDVPGIGICYPFYVSVLGGGNDDEDV